MRSHEIFVLFFCEAMKICSKKRKLAKRMSKKEKKVFIFVPQLTNLAGILATREREPHCSMCALTLLIHKQQTCLYCKRAQCLRLFPIQIISMINKFSHSAHLMHMHRTTEKSERENNTHRQRMCVCIERANAHHNTRAMFRCQQIPFAPSLSRHLFIQLAKLSHNPNHIVYHPKANMKNTNNNNNRYSQIPFHTHTNIEDTGFDYVRVKMCVCYCCVFTDCFCLALIHKLRR